MKPNNYGGWEIRANDEWEARAKRPDRKEIATPGVFNTQNLDEAYWYMLGMPVHRQDTDMWFWRARKCK